MVDVLLRTAVKSFRNTAAGPGISAVVSNWIRGLTQLFASVVLTLVGVEEEVVVADVVAVVLGDKLVPEVVLED